MKKIYLVIFCLFPMFSCSQDKKNSTPSSVKEVHPEVQEQFTTLKFEANGRPCLATINNVYHNFKDKNLFPLSLFITVNTRDADRDGHPTEKEAATFNTLQTKIISELSKELGNYCYVGTTTMNNYRDILLYIDENDQDKALRTLNTLKKANDRIRSYTFEEDTGWEAVAPFYDAISAKN